MIWEGRIALAAITGGLAYAAYDISLEKDGYLAEWFSQYNSNITEPVILKQLPDWPSHPNIPPGTPAPPLLVVDLEKVIMCIFYPNPTQPMILNNFDILFPIFNRR